MPLDSRSTPCSQSMVSWLANRSTGPTEAGFERMGLMTSWHVCRDGIWWCFVETSPWDKSTYMVIITFDGFWWHVMWSNIPCAPERSCSYCMMNVKWTKHLQTVCCRKVRTLWTWWLPFGSPGFPIRGRQCSCSVCMSKWLGGCSMCSPADWQSNLDEPYTLCIPLVI